MPIECQHPLKPLNQDEFGKLTYALVSEVLSIRRDLGRFFDEKHYKNALQLRCPDLILEAPILVSHGTFRKFYFLDVLVALGGVLEFKACEVLTARHKAQLLHYLMLAELSHGLLINVRPERIGKEFVNNYLTLQGRRRFEVREARWNRDIPGAERFRSLLIEFLEDWGTCLDLGLYEEAITHFCGGDAQVIRPVMVTLDSAELGPQSLRFVADATAFKLTAFDRSSAMKLFSQHAQKLVNHTKLDALLWANIGRHEVTFSYLKPEY